jgi:hypothetical protein
MKRALLEELLRALGSVTGRRDLVIIGSQAVHAATDAPPGEVLLSRECDVLLDEDDEASRRIDEALGEQSEFAAHRGVYADTVSSTFPFLPDGWEDRVVTFPVKDLSVRCLEIHDLALSKLAAGRLKDYELVAALLQRGLLDPEIVARRIAAVADLNLRAILLARMQLVRDSIGRG